jgi:hypothetical protein
MCKEVEKFIPRLLEMGYVFINSEGLPVFNNDEDKEAKVTGKYECATLVHERNQNDIASPGEKAGAIFNYNEFSQSAKKLSQQDYELIKKKTIDNMRFEAACMQNPELKQKFIAKFRQPRKWALADSEKDW